MFLLNILAQMNLVSNNVCNFVVVLVMFFVNFICGINVQELIGNRLYCLLMGIFNRTMNINFSEKPRIIIRTAKITILCSIHGISCLYFCLFQ